MGITHAYKCDVQLPATSGHSKAKQHTFPLKLSNIILPKIRFQLTNLRTFIEIFINELLIKRFTHWASKREWQWTTKDSRIDSVGRRHHDCSMTSEWRNEMTREITGHCWTSKYNFLLGSISCVYVNSLITWLWFCFALNRPKCWQGNIFALQEL